MPWCAPRDQRSIYRSQFCPPCGFQGDKSPYPLNHPPSPIIISDKHSLCVGGEGVAHVRNQSTCETEAGGSCLQGQCEQISRNSASTNQNKTKQTLTCVLKILELWFIEAILDGPQMSDRWERDFWPLRRATITCKRLHFIMACIMTKWHWVQLSNIQTSEQLLPWGHWGVSVRHEHRE